MPLLRAYMGFTVNTSGHNAGRADDAFRVAVRAARAPLFHQEVAEDLVGGGHIGDRALPADASSVCSTVWSAAVRRLRLHPSGGWLLNIFACVRVSCIGRSAPCEAGRSRRPADDRTWTVSGVHQRLRIGALANRCDVQHAGIRRVPLGARWRSLAAPPLAFCRRASQPALAGRTLWATKCRMLAAGRRRPVQAAVSGNMMRRLFGFSPPGDCRAADATVIALHPAGSTSGILLYASAPLFSPGAWPPTVSVMAGSSPVARSNVRGQGIAKMVMDPWRRRQTAPTC